MSVLYYTEFWSSTLTLSASISCELTYLLELNLVHCRRHQNRLVGFGPVL